MSALPSGWAPIRLKEVCELINGRAYKQVELLEAGKYPVLRVGNFFTNRGWYYSDLELSADKYCDNGDLLYAWSASFGPRIWDGGKVIYHYHIWKTQLQAEAVDKKLLYYWFDWDKENIKAEHGTGSTMIHVTKGDMEARPLLLPPIAEQHRIVSKLDSLRARSARAAQELDRIPKLIERYKQAILVKAFSGELTRDWRRTHGARNWKQGNAKPYFKWTSGKFLPKSKQSPGRIPVYGGNGPNGLHNKELVAEPTLVIGRVGAHCGNVHLTSGPAWVTDNAIYASEIAATVDARFALLVFRNANLNADAGGSGQPFVNQAILNETDFPLPELAEQQEIVRLVHVASTWLDKIAIEHTRAEHLLPKLDQAILAKAFRGELVPQDPNDKPALVLLELIKRGRAAVSAAPRRKAR